ncbi:MAG: sugar phosphate isomerase/epimerase, partial [Planctomycetes bacterium]|nr:sugar phosphate isomerase/epimerase [Planctomycetota bacterium]
MRCALSVYSMIRPLRAGKIDLLGVADFAHNLGYEGLEMLDMCWPENGLLVDHAHRLRQRGEALGLAISSYAIHNNLAQMDTERQRVEVERVMRAIDIGEELGVSRMRVESTNGPPKDYQGPAEWEDLVPWLVSGIREVAEYAGEKHIVLG